MNIQKSPHLNPTDSLALTQRGGPSLRESAAPREGGHGLLLLSRELLAAQHLGLVRAAGPAQLCD